MSKGNGDIALGDQSVRTRSSARQNEASNAVRFDVLTKITQAFSASGGRLDWLLEALVRELAEGSDSACAVLLLSADETHFTVPHAHASEAGLLAALRAWFPADKARRTESNPALRHVRDTQTALYLPVIELPQARSGRQPSVTLGDAGRDLEVTSLQLVPLLVEGRVAGAIAQFRCGELAEPLELADLALLRSAAEYTALVLCRAEFRRRSEVEAAERQAMGARLRLCAEAAHEFAEASGDCERLLATVARRLALVIGDVCCVRTLSEDGQELERGIVHHVDADVTAWATNLAQQPLAVGQGIAGIVASSGQPLFIPNVTDADWAQELPQHRLLLERLQLGSLMVVPLKCRSEVVGVVSLGRSGNGNPYSQDDLRLVQSIADRAALIVSSARSQRAEHSARVARVKADDALRESEVAYRLLFESSPVPVMAFSRDSTQILAANRAVLRLYGYTHAEMLALKLADLRPHADEAAVRATLAAAGDEQLAGIVQHKRKDGTLFFAEYHSHCLQFLGHRARITVITDVTARHEAEQMRALLSAIVCSSNDAIISQDLDGTITSWNAAAETLFGYSSAEIVGRRVRLLIPDAVLTEDKMLIETVAAGRPVMSYDTVRLHKNGDLVPVSLSIAPILDKTGKVVGASKTARDLRAQLAAAATLRKTEEQFRQAQKLEAVGRLAGGIAHDFNNALSVILSCSELVLDELGNGSSARDDVEEIRRAAVRASELTRQLLLFSRQQVAAPRVLDLNQVIADLEKMLQRILGEDVELAAIRAPRLGQVLADPTHIDQVLMNLVVNARDAMPKGGKLTIETANIELDSTYELTHLGEGVKPGSYVMLAVTDTGHGMDEATQARIFEPFFTTKELGKGTGLGLSTVFGIVQQAGGCVLVYSEVGRGTSFKIYLPQVNSLANTQQPAPVGAMRRGTETILLVEDQDHVRAVANAILKRAGYTVLVAPSPKEALKLSDRHRGGIDLLLTDVVMPQMSGLELAKRVQEARPNIRVLYMSGYTDDSVVRHGVLDGEMAFLQKPFTVESLGSRVRGVLDGIAAVQVGG